MISTHTLEVGGIQLVVAQRGARVLALRDQVADVDWMNPAPRKQAVVPSSPIWADHARAGWDEMFPSIEPSDVLGRRTPDHGDIWNVDWALAVDGDTIEATYNKANFYSFTRSLRVLKQRIVASYAVTSTAAVEQPFVWAAHPLMPGRVDLTGAISSGTPVVVGYSTLPGLKAGDQLNWGSVVPGTDWRLGDQFDGAALKCFVAAPARVPLRLGSSRLTFELDQVSIPWLGIWLNSGAWPQACSGDRHIAIEPTTAPVDGLASAIRGGHARILEPGGTVRWSFEMTMETGTSDDAR